MRKRRRFQSSTQLLWDKLQSDWALYLLCTRREELSPLERDILEQCRSKLELAKECLDRRAKRPFSFWSILHEVDGLLLLVLPEEMLPSRGREILQRFDQKITDMTQRRLWLGSEGSGPLPQAVELLALREMPSEPSPQLTAEQLSQCRHILSGALSVVNEQVDQGFWQLSINVVIQLLSGLLIIGLTLLSILAFPGSGDRPEQSQGVSWSYAVIFSLFGMIGATLSNMLSKEAFIVASGATARYFGYYLFLKPLIGGFAALFVFLVEQTRMLLQVVIRGTSGSVASTAIQINVDNEVQAFLARAAIGLVAGFFADRVLSSMMEQVLDRILRKSEKNPAVAARVEDSSR